MKIKKSIIFFGVVFCTLFLCTAAYAQEELTVSQPRFYVQGQEIFQLRQGEISGQVTVKNNTDSVQQAVLLLAVYNEAGQMEGLNAKQLELAPNAVGDQQQQISIASAQGRTLRLYVWGGVGEKAVSFSPGFALSETDTPPARPSEITQTASTYYSVSLAWEVPYDNLGVASYEVYREGTLVAQTQEPAYTDQVADYGTEYHYTIKAVDGAGNKSEESLVFSAQTKDAAYCIFGAENQTNLFDRPIPVDGEFNAYYSEVATVGPPDDQRECRMITFIKPYNGDPNGMANYLQLGIDRTYIAPTDRTVTVRVTYWDSGTDNIGIDYNSESGGAYKNTTFFKTDTGQWKTYDVVLTDAAFDDKQVGGQYDLRLNSGSSNTKDYIYKVEIFNGLAE